MSPLVFPGRPVRSAPRRSGKPIGGEAALRPAAYRPVRGFSRPCSPGRRPVRAIPGVPDRDGSLHSRNGRRKFETGSPWTRSRTDPGLVLKIVPRTTPAPDRPEPGRKIDSSLAGVRPKGRGSRVASGRWHRFCDRISASSIGRPPKGIGDITNSGRGSGGLGQSECEAKIIQNSWSPSRFRDFALGLPGPPAFPHFARQGAIRRHTVATTSRGASFNSTRMAWWISTIVPDTRRVSASPSRIPP